jgi:hypothetical protein
MDDKELLAWTLARAHLLTACDLNRAHLALPEAKMSAAERRRHRKRLQVLAMAVHFLGKRVAAGREALEAGGEAMQESLRRVVAEKLQALFVKWTRRGRVGGLPYVIDLTSWLKASEEEVRLALPRLKSHWPMLCQMVEELLQAD